MSPFSVPTHAPHSIILKRAIKTLFIPGSNRKFTKKEVTFLDKQSMTIREFVSRRLRKVRPGPGV